MRGYFHVFATILMVTFFSCSRKTTDAFTNSSLVGKWVLTKSCICGSCKEANSLTYKLTLVFSASGQLQLSGSEGNSVHHYSGTYWVTHQSGWDILNINLDSTAAKYFLYLPGSIIFSETETTLTLDLNTPFANPCLYRNAYTAVPG
jgi:hypothetical protein